MWDKCKQTPKKEVSPFWGRNGDFCVYSKRSATLLPHGPTNQPPNHREKPFSGLHKSFLSHPLFTLMCTDRGAGILTRDLFTHFDCALTFILSLGGGVSKRKESQIPCWKSTGRQGVVHGIFTCNHFWESIRSVLGEHLYSSWEIPWLSSEVSEQWWWFPWFTGVRQCLFCFAYPFFILCSGKSLSKCSSVYVERTCTFHD